MWLINQSYIFLNQHNVYLFDLHVQTYIILCAYVHTYV